MLYLRTGRPLLLYLVAGMLLLAPRQASGQTYQGYTLAEARHLRSLFTESAIFDGGAEIARYIYLHMPEFYEHAVIDRAGPVRDLPVNLRDDVASVVLPTRDGPQTLQGFATRSTIDGLIIVHEGQIVFETYPRMFPSEKHLGMSVSKVYVSTLIAILQDRGEIDVRRPVSSYLPALTGSAWDNVVVLDLLDMTTGVCDDARSEDNACSDDFFAAALGDADPAATFAVLSAMEAHRPPGEVVEYSNVANTVLTMLLETITGLPFPSLFEREIWQRSGASHDALIWIEASGRSVALGGVSTTLRDLARFGLLFTPSGRQGPRPLISAAYLSRIQDGGRPDVFAATSNLGLEIFDDPSSSLLVDGERPRHSTYQWDVVMRDGDFYKGGYRGQGLYVSPGRDLVIAFFSHDTNEMPRMARRLAKSRLFSQ